jgi:low temperature requirement protein LtrA
VKEGERGNLLRVRKGHEPGRVTYMELFFDLVFVFAVTQLSHTLLRDVPPAGALRTAFLLMAVWWVWIYTSWVTNWLDPERTPVRLLLLALMLAGLILSTSLPDAFGARGLSFALAYAFMQVGRSLFMLKALRGRNPANFRNFQRITIWLAITGFLWIAGGLLPPSSRPICWAAALLLEYISPAVAFWTPGLGRSTTADWTVEGHHLAERCALFVIIALGESVLVTGATFGELDWTPPAIAAFVTAFLASVTMWWIYFDKGAEFGSHTIVTSADPGRLARAAFTYIHLFIVAGIIVAAVGDELIQAHPAADCDAKTAAVMLAGVGLYLLGNGLFKRAVGGRFPPSHVIGLILLALSAPLAPGLSVLAFGMTTTLSLVAVAAWEMIGPRRPARA